MFSIDLLSHRTPVLSCL